VTLDLLAFIIGAAAFLGPPIFLMVPWALYRPASPYPVAAAGAVFAALFGWAGLFHAAALSSLWVLVGGVWCLARRSRRRTDWETVNGWLEAARQEQVEGLPQRRDEAA
jgi:hypothetical protein